MTYIKTEIGKLVTLRQGFAINKKTNHYISNEPTNLYLLRIGDMKENDFSIFIKDTIPEKFIASENDIIYTRTGQVGLVFRNQHGVVHNNCFTVTSKDELILYQNYLYYALQDKEFYEEANSRATGAAQPDLPHGAFNSIQVYLPSIKRQYRIVEILDKYDAFIENNQKQIKLLEEAAQRLYKEWFVDLRFPGYDDVKIVDGVPEGWRKQALNDFIEFEIGGGWGEESFTQKCTKPAYVIRGTDIYGLSHGDFHNIPYRYHVESNLKPRTLQNGDIIFEVSGGSKNEGVAKTFLISQQFIEQFSNPIMCASFCKMIRPKGIFSQYLFNSFQYMRKNGKTTEYDKRSASSIVNYRWKDFLLYEYLLVPPENIMLQYNLYAQNLYSDVINRSISIEVSKQARDRLLPKLMSGELEV